MMTADEIVRQLDALRAQIARSATDIRDCELRAADASEEHSRAYAVAYVAATGSVEERRQAAILATLPARRLRDRAEIEMRFVKQRAHDLEAQQSNLQTQARLIGGAS
jgi:hypothetical protein